MAAYLAFKEVWRNKGRFFLFSLVISLITTLVLFIAALAEGLALANKQYLEKLDAQILVFQKNVQLSPNTSRLDLSKLNNIARVEGVSSVGPLGFSNGTLVFADGRDDLNVSLIGVEAGKPGSPPVLEGEPLVIDRGFEVVIDRGIATRADVKVGDTIVLKTIQGSENEFYNLRVIGMTDERQYLFAPSIFLPYRTWEQVRPGGANQGRLVDSTSNVIAVQIKPDYTYEQVSERIVNEVPDVEVADIITTYKNLPGYAAQQSTLDTQRGFTLLIGLLVIGGFFQIQMLQKVPQIGVLKAIGASNTTVGAAAVGQIVLVTTFGVLVGALVSLGLAAGIPNTVPIVFNGQSVLVAVVTLLLIGPIGGLVSVRLAVSVEPLIALGLSN
ncbi:MAG: ABC transporter permease [Chloroflexota bacterium]